VQEQFQFISSGKIPQTLTVVMEGSVSTVPFRPGDDLTITGVLSYRYKKLQKDFAILPQLIVAANSILIEKSGNYISQTNEELDRNSEREMSKIYANFPLNYYSGYELTSK
jgi:DNA replicative helicase MCM subunit Mcm2 (Cdc46/Mcm family)